MGKLFNLSALLVSPSVKCRQVYCLPSRAVVNKIMNVKNSVLGPTSRRHSVNGGCGTW